jgi:tripartite-type tricarboxylate transporter receptor subunit TctC
MPGLRTIIALLTATLVAVSFAGGAGAQEYPSRTITFVVPFPAGGLSDVAARIVAQEMQKRLGQTFVVENRVGGSGTIGGSYVARAAPDGYTLLVNAGADTTNPHYMQLTYDPIKDFSPIGMIAEGPPLVLIVSPSSPYKSVQELVAGARANPGKLSFGSSGRGTSPSIAVSQLKFMANIDVIDVPYRGATQALVGVMSGEVQASFGFQSTAKVPADEGKVRALAITSAQRSSSWPQLPTMNESGFPGFEHQGFVGLTAPAKTPASVIGLLNRHLNAIVSAQSFRTHFAPFGMQPREKNSPEDFAEYIQRATELYGELAKRTKS